MVVQSTEKHIIINIKSSSDQLYLHLMIIISTSTLSFVFQRVELCVRCLEMWLEHRLEDSATLIVAFQVQGRLAAIAKPLPNKYVHLSTYVHVHVYMHDDHTMHACMCVHVGS